MYSMLSIHPSLDNSHLFEKISQSISQNERSQDTNAIIKRYYPLDPIHSENIPVYPLPVEEEKKEVSYTEQDSQLTSDQFLQTLGVHVLQDDINDYIQSSDLNTPLVASGKLIRPVQLDGPTVTLSKLITLAEFKTIPKSSSGGRVGLTPVIVDSDNVHKVILGRAGNGLLGDFGGGIKYKENESPYQALIRETTEEVPSWSPYLVDCLENHPERVLAIHYQEQYNPSLVRAYYPLRIYITVYLLIPQVLLSVPLSHMRELTACYKIPLEKYKDCLQRVRELFPGDMNQKNDYRFWKIQRPYLIGINSGLVHILDYFLV
jgi:hypothetical protein